MDDFRDVQARAGQMFSRNVVFLTGISRSSLTWIGEALNSHPDIICEGETHVFDWLVPAFEGALGQYNGKLGQLTESLANHGDAPALPGYVQGDLDYLTRIALSLSLARFDAGRNADVIIDRTPESVFFLDRMTQAAPEAKVIHIVRDGRDEAIASWEFNMAGSTRDAFLKRYPSFEAFVAAFTKTWVQGTGAGKAFGRKYWDRYFEFRIEDLVHNPAPGIKALFDFLEVESDDAIVDKAVARTAPVVISEPGGWRELFDPGTDAQFKQQAGELLKLLGYPI